MVKTALTNRIENLTNKGRYREALEKIDEALQPAEKENGSVRLRQLKGLAEARLGRLAAAQKTLRGLYEEGHLNAETLGIYARTWMDRYDRSGNKGHLKQSRDLYAEAFEADPKDYYTGINAAAKSVFLGDQKAAQAYASRVAKIVGKDVKEGDYWQSATAAEVQLIQRNYRQAAELYTQAVDLEPDDRGSHSSTWLQAKRLLRALQASKADQALVWSAFKHLRDEPPSRAVSDPPFRRLRVYAFDPSLARRLDTTEINEITLLIPWESEAADGDQHAKKSGQQGKHPPTADAETLNPGPIGEYLEVIDFDPSSGCFYDPIDLNDKRLLATDGIAPYEGDPRFHQQMVYAVGMTVIDHFERALGRPALWASHKVRDGSGKVIDEQFVRRLRIYPHALREANAYYSPRRKALLFGYFPSESDDPQIYPGGIIFTCLSHDVVAHEMSHALLDGLHPRFVEPSNLDVHAFHEAFADIVALFQHFSHPEVLRHEIARTRGDLASQSMLGQLAQQFGRAIGRYGALRDAIGEVDPETREWSPRAPDPGRLASEREPHVRGSILVAAVFNAFLTIYRSRIADLLRIATGGSGVLEPGALHPDLVARLADEAAKSAKHLLHICIRGLDYCPPVDITFGDYLRAIITADIDMVPDDRLNYRIAIIEAFQRHGIYPADVRNLSVESVVWRPPRSDELNQNLDSLFDYGHGKSALAPEWRPTESREELWDTMNENAKIVHRWLRSCATPLVADELGLELTVDAPRSIYRGRRGRQPAVEVHSVRVARRATPRGDYVTDLVVEILQRRRGYLDRDQQRKVDARTRSLPRNEHGDFTFRGGCTLLIDPATCKVRYAITKHILSEQRLEGQRRFLTDEGKSLRATYFGDAHRSKRPLEPFAILHRDLEGEDAP